MVKAVFQIEVEPVNDFITVEGLEIKLRRMACGFCQHDRLTRSRNRAFRNVYSLAGSQRQTGYRGG
mgnify:CR=1 FL=1